MKKYKCFFLGFLSATIVFALCFSAYAASVKKNIAVELNKYSVTVNGNPVKGDTILYNGTTYIPMRAVLEAADCQVNVIEKDKKINVANNFYVCYKSRMRINSIEIPDKYAGFYNRNDSTSTDSRMYIDMYYLLDQLKLPYNLAGPDANNYFDITIGTSASTKTSATAAAYKFPFYLYSNSGQVYLGKLVTSTTATDGVWNPYSTYGSKYSTSSIFDEYGTYGSPYSNESAFNSLATKPPKITDSNGNVYGYLTTNTTIPNGYTIEKLKQYLINNGQ